MITDKELNEIQERCDKATGGKWWWIAGSGYPEDGSTSLRATRISPWREVLSVSEGAFIEAAKADKAFIAHARADMPKLLAELARLREAQRKVGRIAQAEGHSPCRSGGIDGEGVCANVCICEWAEEVRKEISEVKR